MRLLTVAENAHIELTHTAVLYQNDANRRRDPTRTTKLRGRYTADMNDRFHILKQLINTTLVDNDALRLSGERPSVFVRQLVGSKARPANRFHFKTDAERVQAFMDWLRDAVDQEVLEVRGRDGNTITHDGWQEKYIREAYVRAVEAADAAMQREGIEDLPDSGMGKLFTAPIHADALELLYTRSFEELRGITEAMSQQIGRVLAEGLAKGLSNRDIAKNIVDRVDKIGMTRAKMLARTEIINVYAEGSLNRLEQMGIAEVTAVVEFASADDDHVCATCSSLDGTVYTIAEARGLIPVHPNCRCAWIPVLFPDDGE